MLVPSFVEFSGDARVAELQVRALVEHGNQVEVYALTADMSPRGADVFTLGMPKNPLFQRLYRLLLPLNIFLTLRWLYMSKKVDLMICHLYPMTWLAFMSKLLYRTRYVFWFHGIEEPEVFSKAYERIYMRLHILLTRITTCNVDEAVSVSHFAKEKLYKYTGLQSAVIFNKADPQRFHPEIDGSEVRQRYNLEGVPVILYVGRLAPQKGVHLLIQAFVLIRKTIPDAKLVLVGDPTFSYYFRHLKDISDHSVIFAGHVSSQEIAHYYAMCDIYATCSLWENCNLPVLEAQACGKTVVAFDIDAFKENAGQNMCLVEKLDIEGFSEACIRVIRKVRDAVAGR
jgi:1,2-diacylglycerol 3-alpha-glucosyltransferase